MCQEKDFLCLHNCMMLIMLGVLSIVKTVQTVKYMNAQVVLIMAKISFFVGSLCQFNSKLIYIDKQYVDFKRQYLKIGCLFLKIILSSQLQNYSLEDDNLGKNCQHDCMTVKLFIVMVKVEWQRFFPFFLHNLISPHFPSIHLHRVTASHK